MKIKETWWFYINYMYIYYLKGVIIQQNMIFIPPPKKKKINSVVQNGNKTDFKENWFDYKYKFKRYVVR